MAPAAERKLAPGTVVEVCGLRDNTEFNGVRGHILNYVWETGRYRVRVNHPRRTIANLRDANVRPVQGAATTGPFDQAWSANLEHARVVTERVFSSASTPLRHMLPPVTITAKPEDTPSKAELARRAANDLFPKQPVLDPFQATLVDMYVDLLPKMKAVKTQAIARALWKSVLNGADAYTQSQGRSRIAMMQYMRDQHRNMEAVLDEEIARQRAV